MKSYLKKIYALPDTAKKLARKALADRSFFEQVRYKTFRAELSQVMPKDQGPHAELMFKGKGKPIIVQMDARTTMVTAYGNQIKPPPFKARSLEPGMKCEVSWTGPDTTASVLVCGD